MNLDLELWRPFYIGSIFSIINGKGITKEEIEAHKGDFNAVQSGEINNGVIGKIDLVYCKERGYTFTTNPCLTVARTGSAGYVSFQEKGCVVGDSAKLLMLPETIAEKEVYIFLQTVLNKIKYKYNYGRKVTEEKYAKEIIYLPVSYEGDNPIIDAGCTFSKEGFIPDWDYMKRYINSLHSRPITTKISNSSNNIDISGFKTFTFGRLVENIYKANKLNRADLMQGNNITSSIRYITRTDYNNGCEFLANIDGIEPCFIEKGNAITIGDTTATCTYQAERFVAGDHMVVIRAEWLNKYTALYILTLLNREKYRYNYGRAFVIDKIKNTELLLPVIHDDKGNIFIDKNKNYSVEGYVPDWEYMEKYIKKFLKSY